MMTQISKFIHQHTAYDLVPISTQVIILDAALPLTKAIKILLYHGLTIAPLWKAESMAFLGLLSVSDLIQFVQNTTDDSELDWNKVILETLIDHQSENDTDCPFIKVHPLRSLVETTQMLIDGTGGRPFAEFVPLIDIDPITNQEMLVSVINKSTILQFLACYCPSIHQLTSTISDLKLGTSISNLQTLSLKSTFHDATQQMLNHQISGVPIVSEDGHLIDVFTETDVLINIRDLSTVSKSITMNQIIHKRSIQDLEPIYTCEVSEPVYSLLNTIQLGFKSGKIVKRFIIVNEEQQVNGILSLGDLLAYIWRNFVSLK